MQPTAAKNPPRGRSEYPPPFGFGGNHPSHQWTKNDRFPTIIKPPNVPRTAKIDHRRKSIIESYFLNIGEFESPRESRNAVRSSTSFSVNVSKRPVGIIEVFDVMIFSTFLASTTF
jgi:hypothetical protein